MCSAYYQLCTSSALKEVPTRYDKDTKYNYVPTSSVVKMVPAKYLIRPEQVDVGILE